MYDNPNESFLKVAFALLQMVLILVVYAFVYTSALVVRELAARGEMSAAGYAVPFIVALAVPYAFWRFRKMFAKGARLQAAAWSFAAAAVGIVALSVFSVNIAGV